jgi:hypothetical protein
VTTREFAISYVIADSAIAEFGRALIDEAREYMRGELSKSLRGPRGGQYVPISEVRLAAEHDAFKSTFTLLARRRGRYVRPRR